MISKCLICIHNKTLLNNNCLGISCIYYCDKKHDKEYSSMNGCNKDFEEVKIKCIYCNKQILVSQSFKGFCSNDCFKEYKNKIIKSLEKDNIKVELLKNNLKERNSNISNIKKIRKQITQLQKDINEKKYILENIKCK